MDQQSLETPPVKPSNYNPLEMYNAYSPLTPGQSPEGLIFEVNGDDPYILTSLSLRTVHIVENDGSIKTDPDHVDYEVKAYVTPDASPCGVTEIAEHNSISPIDYQSNIDSSLKENEEKRVKKRRTRIKLETTEGNVKPTTRALQYPPCFVCSGKASGDHYGVNSCEACKGFFRRYLLREKGAYSCKKSGKCEVVYTVKGMCAGCRLKKCLELGMSKEKCKLGRYSSEKRTEKIKTALELKGNITTTSEHQVTAVQDEMLEMLESPSQDSATQDEIISRTLSQLDISDDRQKTFCDDLVADLIKAKNKMKTFDMERCLTDEEIKTRIREYHDQYVLKLKMYGEMKTVPKEEFSKLYGDFGIDVDDRMKELKRCQENIEEEVNGFCNFAKRVPYFSKLSFKDQSNLLKVGRMDFYTTLLSQGYDPDLQILLYKFRPYHIDEMDKFFSKELMHNAISQYRKCQKLNLNESEKSLVMALSLFFTDRCSLENVNLVEMIQLSLAQMLRNELEKTCPDTARLRFTKVIDYLTSLREVGEKYFKEYEDLCRDDLYVNECPVLTDFLFEA